LFQTSNRQAIGRAKRTLVGATMEGAIGFPTARLAFAVGSKTAVLAKKAERDEGSKPVKPLGRINRERKHTLVWADKHIETLGSIFPRDAQRDVITEQ